ncbi:tetratricopeptide repeat protein [Pseudobutyrivibrio xylanivorans]|uniref:SEL1-like repeat protein n=1 Tax=Pseudobutyrivibrio xylanivorans TaxID=185007 RepID=A0A5P6VTD6_PSEXY|nr:SEL1-like repeat protein [Pseudobutyrivibrio xylanivorans]QFJ55893.1 SEL1-like repeat protein [Pseudobutyrivibrio xylanivorans]
MKRNFRLILLIAASAVVFMGCSKEMEEKTEEEQATTEQVAFDDVKVEDYTILSYSELEVLAYEGDTEAQVMLGRSLEYGTEDIKQNFYEALSWYQMASDSGNVEGTCALGYFYLTGAGVDVDLDKAAELFNTAIENGSVNAKVGLARVMLAQGDYEALAEAESLEDTADESSVNSQEQTEKSTVQAETTKTVTTKTVATKTDSAKTEKKSDDKSTDSDEEAEPTELDQIIDLLTVAQQAGDLDGGYYLGYIYEKGIGVLQDYKKAFDYYNRVTKSSSTALNDRDAINLSNIAIGLMYVKGYGVEANPETALEYFTTASDNNSPKASYYIGQMYENGIGADKDYEKAMEFYLKAADLNYAPALNQIGYLYYNGYGVDVDFASAVYYQKLAALQGYPIAQVNLGFLYENGYGVERNLETALSYYEMAASAGYEGANEAVVRVMAQINEEM